MSRGICMTRAPVVRVRGGWGGTHLRYLAVKSAVRYWPITILPLDSSLTLMEWVGEVFKSLSIGGWQILGGCPSTPAAPSVLRAAPQNHTRGRNLALSPTPLWVLPIPFGMPRLTTPTPFLIAYLVQAA